jgi:hypothetical protein
MKNPLSIFCLFLSLSSLAQTRAVIPAGTRISSYHNSSGPMWSGPNNYNPNPPAADPAYADATSEKHMQECLARHPWRVISGVTNSIAGSGWLWVSGRVVGVFPDGLYMKGIIQPLNPKEPVGPAEFFLVNFPYQVAEEDVLPDTEYYLAKSAGVYTYQTVLGSPHTIHKFDYGTPCAAPEAPKLSPEQLAAIQAATAKKKTALAAAALKFNQDQAAAGNPAGQYRLAQRYLVGDGVETNVDQARELFAAAARQGHSEAAAALARLASAPTAAPEK